MLEQKLYRRRKDFCVQDALFICLWLNDNGGAGAFHTFKNFHKASSVMDYFDI